MPQCMISGIQSITARHKGFYQVTEEIKDICVYTFLTGKEIKRGKCLFVGLCRLLTPNQDDASLPFCVFLAVVLKSTDLCFVPLNDVCSSVPELSAVSLTVKAEMFDLSRIIKPLTFYYEL